mmetsp:Transcript_13700/g.33742  ORF Transcript_13700/g.33742 Transcript_13700/m.33742 type:complete len:212 (+) Transcript_13700:1840-2475(+)
MRAAGEFEAALPAGEGLGVGGEGEARRRFAGGDGRVGEAVGRGGERIEEMRGGDAGATEADEVVGEAAVLEGGGIGEENRDFGGGEGEGACAVGPENGGPSGKKGETCEGRRSFGRWFGSGGNGDQTRECGGGEASLYFEPPRCAAAGARQGAGRAGKDKSTAGRVKEPRGPKSARLEAQKRRRGGYEQAAGGRRDAHAQGGRRDKPADRP